MTNYLYGRNFKRFNGIKIGMTICPKSRNDSYIKMEIERGNFEFIYEVKCDNIYEFDNKLKERINEFYIKDTNECFNRDVINEIQIYLNDDNIEYYKLTEDEIENLDYKTEEGKEMSVKRGLVKFNDNYYN